MILLKRQVLVDGKTYLLTISDDEKALLAAAAAGGAVLGIWNEQNPMKDFGAAAYLVEDPDDVTDRFAERIVRRHLGLPWVIGETERLVVREFCAEDAAAAGEELFGQDAAGRREPQIAAADHIFLNRDTLAAYIRGQYHFYEYGIWAVVEKQSGIIIGRAGITDFPLNEKETAKEAGYQIFKPYRGAGYGLEAMKEILSYGREELDIHRLYARIDPSNVRSIRLAEKLGFSLVQTDSGSVQSRLLYAVNLKAWPDKGALK